MHKSSGSVNPTDANPTASVARVVSIVAIQLDKSPLLSLTNRNGTPKLVFDHLPGTSLIRRPDRLWGVLPKENYREITQPSMTAGSYV